MNYELTKFNNSAKAVHSKVNTFEHPLGQFEFFRHLFMVNISIFILNVVNILSSNKILRPILPENIFIDCYSHGSGFKSLHFTVVREQPILNTHSHRFTPMHLKNKYQVPRLKYRKNNLLFSC